MLLSVHPAKSSLNRQFRQDHGVQLGSENRWRVARSVLSMGPRTAVTAVFFLNAAAFSSWYSRLPALQERLDLGPGRLALPSWAHHWDC